MSAGITHCTVRKGWVTKTRPGLPNHAMAGVCYANLALAGPPAWGEEARKFGREIQKNLGLKPAKDPLMREMGELIAAGRGRGRAAPGPAALAEELHLRRLHRLHVALPDGAAHDRPRHAGAAEARGYQYPDWVWNALGGYSPTIDPTVFAAARTIGPTLIDLMTKPAVLAAAQGRIQGAHRRRHRRQGLGAAPPRQELQGAHPLPLAGIRDHAARREWWIPAGREVTGTAAASLSDGPHAQREHDRPARRLSPYRLTEGAHGANSRNQPYAWCARDPGFADSRNSNDGPHAQRRPRLSLG